MTYLMLTVRRGFVGTVDLVPSRLVLPGWTCVISVPSSFFDRLPESLRPQGWSP